MNQTQLSGIESLSYDLPNGIKDYYVIWALTSSGAMIQSHISCSSLPTLLLYHGSESSSYFTHLEGSVNFASAAVTSPPPLFRLTLPCSLNAILSTVGIASHTISTVCSIATVI
jgi:hypothetical protein